MVTVDGASIRALAYPDLIGSPEVGDRVLLNTAALTAGLGTGGYALVVAIPDRLPADREPAGHIVKARYTPLQVMTESADEQGSAYHDALAAADSLDGMPVVTADLHSALPAVLAGIYGAEGTGAADSPAVAYVMTDGGALPAWFSRTAAGLREAGWLAATITAGQAFGGDLEAVTVHSALLAARHAVGAAIAVVAQGPGNLGTGTTWGYSGVAAGEAVNAAAVLSGRPVASLRISFADPRPRHQGISHHSQTAYGRVALARADVVLPSLPGPRGARLTEAAAPLGARHNLVTVPTEGLLEALGRSPVPLSTMGRGLDEEREYFLAAAAAGRHARSLLARLSRSSVGVPAGMVVRCRRSSRSRSPSIARNPSGSPGSGARCWGTSHRRPRRALPAGTPSIARCRRRNAIHGSPALTPPARGRDCSSSAFPKARSSRTGCTSTCGSAPGSSAMSAWPHWRPNAPGWSPSARSACAC
jgi:hypothetical protein